MRRYAIVFAVLVGTGMIGMWAMFFASGQVGELESAPVALGFHLVAEALTALSLLVAGVGLIKGASWARTLYLFALGLFVYTAIVSPGYFAQQGDWALVLMFAALMLAALPAVLGVTRSSIPPRHRTSA